MKTIDEYMALPYKIEIMPDADEGGFAARLPELPGCITVGETKEDALANIEDAKRAWLEAAMEDGQSIPEPFSLDDYSGQFKLRIPKSLHRLLAEHAREEGTSMNQYCLYLLAKNDTAEGVNGL
jgi:predicted RNase H-like HicB family nuclease